MISGKWHHKKKNQHTEISCTPLYTNDEVSMKETKLSNLNSIKNNKMLRNNVNQGSQRLVQQKLHDTTERNQRRHNE